jgi:tetratricopeptide (TPR) repeat protein
LDGDFATAVKEASRLPLGRLSPEVQITLGRGGLVVQQPAFAAAAIQEYLITQPTDVSAWLDLSRAQYLAGRIERALQAAERAVILEPDDDKAHALMGHALAKLDRVPEAAAAYRQAHYYGADPEESRAWLTRLESRAAADADVLVPRPAAAPGGSRGD